MYDGSPIKHLWNVKQMTIHVFMTINNYSTANRVGYGPVVN